MCPYNNSKPKPGPWVRRLCLKFEFPAQMAKIYPGIWLGMRLRNAIASLGLARSLELRRKRHGKSREREREREKEGRGEDSEGGGRGLHGKDGALCSAIQMSWGKKN